MEIEYGLIGKKLGHSFSANYFNPKFESEGIPAHYYLFEIDNINELPKLLSTHPCLRGLNVTIPYKEKVLPYLDSLTSTAKEIGAVNAIKIERISEKTVLLGHNTDAVGFEEAILPILGCRHHALVLGTGGASKAIIYSLRKLGVEVDIVSRRHSLPECFTYDELNEEVMRAHDIIVNCTPLGMWPKIDECPPIPYHLIDNRYLCFDLVYNPEETLFMKLAASQGAVVRNGLLMLINQAVAGYRFWNSVDFVSDKYNPSQESSYIFKRIMSRRIEVSFSGKNPQYYFLSIANIWYNSANEIVKLHIEPYEKEVPGVIYIDTLLKLSVDPD